jgi:hypothetical protein
MNILLQTPLTPLIPIQSRPFYPQNDRNSILHTHRAYQLLTPPAAATAAGRRQKGKGQGKGQKMKKK